MRLLIGHQLPYQSLVRYSLSLSLSFSLFLSIVIIHNNVLVSSFFLFLLDMCEHSKIDGCCSRTIPPLERSKHHMVPQALSQQEVTPIPQMEFVPTFFGGDLPSQISTRAPHHIPYHTIPYHTIFPLSKNFQSPSTFISKRIQFNCAVWSADARWLVLGTQSGDLALWEGKDYNSHYIPNPSTHNPSQPINLSTYHPINPSKGKR